MKQSSCKLTAIAEVSPIKLPAKRLLLILPLRAKLRLRIRIAGPVIIQPVEPPVAADQILVVKHDLKIVVPLFYLRHAEVVDRERLTVQKPLRLPCNLFTLQREALFDENTVLVNRFQSGSESTQTQIRQATFRRRRYTKRVRLKSTEPC